LANFIASYIKILKKDLKFFLKFLKKILKLMLNKNKTLTKLKGIKITIRGRLLEKRKKKKKTKISRYK